MNNFVGFKANISASYCTVNYMSKIDMSVLEARVDMFHETCSSWDQ